MRLILSKGMPLRSSMPITQSPVALEVKSVCVSFAAEKSVQFSSVPFSRSVVSDSL